MKRLALLQPVLVTLALGACRELNPPPRVEAQCQAACERQAHRCSEHQCARGCAFVLDRLVENESPPILACVAAIADAPGAAVGNDELACGDPVWADCAVRIGIHSDGGPPAPFPRQD